QPDGTPFCFVDNGRESTGLNAIEWAQQVESLGAGEILLTSVDREGTGNGFDIPLVKQIADLVNIPVIAHGGAGTAVHVADVIKKGHADAVALASLLHYGVYAELASDSDDFNAEGNTQFMKRNATNKRIKPVHLADLKASLTSAGLPMRLPHAQT
ncbi:MAG: HisA/HisF-related TIM barrel protein, partial [Candidatus Methylacidiphilales bacterium]